MNAADSTPNLPPNLPTLSLADFRGEPAKKQAFLADLRDALYSHGFFYLLNHGVAADLIDEVMTATKQFFALPMVEKLKIEMVNSPHFRGYNRAGAEVTREKQDWREQLDINTESAPYDMTPKTPLWRRLQGPNQWPEGQPGLRPILLAYQAEVTRVGVELLRAIAAALGQHENAFADIYEPTPSQLLKIIRYPGRDAVNTDQGVGTHRDGGFVTLLLQGTVPGLRVQMQDGSWTAAPPRQNTFVINAGELLELATNGLVRAAIHDVVTPPAGAERYSVAFFLGSRPDAIVPVIALPDGLKSLQRGVSVDPLNPIFREVGLNQLKSRLRSQPDVANAHYGDQRPNDGFG